jgi:hypothetical protein
MLKTRFDGPLWRHHRPFISTADPAAQAPSANNTDE